MRMHRIILSSVAWLALSCFCTLSRKRHDFRKKLLNITMFRFSLQLSSETFLILRKIQRCIVLNVCAFRPSYKKPVILVILSLNLDFLDRYSKKYRKIRLVGAELFHADRQTRRLTGSQWDRQTERQRDMTKLTVAFREFANALKDVNEDYYICRVTSCNLTLRLLMSYIDGAPILDVSRSHTTTQHSR